MNIDVRNIVITAVIVGLGVINRLIVYFLDHIRTRKTATKKLFYRYSQFIIVTAVVAGCTVAIIKIKDQIVYSPGG